MLAKYQEWLTEEGLIKVQGYARDGMTDTEMAEAMRISRSTLNTWLKKFPQMAAVIKAGKEVADRKVENSLFERATGKIVTLKKPIKVRKIIYDENTGKKCSEAEEIEYVDEEEYIPADTKAIIFWLTNRKPDEWKQRVEVANSEEGMYGTVEIESRGKEDDVIDGEYEEVSEDT